MENRAELKFIELKNMVETLNDSINLVLNNTEIKLDRALRDSVIQRFEYSIEWIWKFLKYYLLENYWEEAEFSKEVIKKAYKAKLIEDLSLYIDMINKRNRLSHDYHEDFAKLSFDIIIDEYIDEINNFINNFSKKYDN